MKLYHPAVRTAVENLRDMFPREQRTRDALARLVAHWAQALASGAQVAELQVDAAELARERGVIDWAESRGGFSDAARFRERLVAAVRRREYVGPKPTRYGDFVQGDIIRWRGQAWQIAEPSGTPNVWIVISLDDQTDEATVPEREMAMLQATPQRLFADKIADAVRRREYVGEKPAR